MKMKFKNFILFILLIVLVEKGFSSNFKNMESEINDELYKRYLYSTIPEKFVEPFFKMTKSNKSVGIEILGVGFHESEWKYFVGKVNANNSIDLGPLMLNSYNIANKEFMRRFASKSEQYKYDTDVYYMTVCITFFKALRTQYGIFNALKVYNGGRRVLNKDVPTELAKTVTRYANKVCKNINSVHNSWTSFKELNETTVRNEVIMKNIIENSQTSFDFYQEKGVEIEASYTLIDTNRSFDSVYRVPKNKYHYLREEHVRLYS